MLSEQVVAVVDLLGRTTIRSLLSSGSKAVLSSETLSPDELGMHVLSSRNF